MRIDAYVLLFALPVLKSCFYQPSSDNVSAIIRNLDYAMLRRRF